jgi:hypothetical protein
LVPLNIAKSGFVHDMPLSSVSAVTSNATVTCPALFGHTRQVS